MAEKIAGRLVDIGFFERRGDRINPQYWLPFVYRPALHSIQGSADAPPPDTLGDPLDPSLNPPGLQSPLLV